MPRSITEELNKKVDTLQEEVEALYDHSRSPKLLTLDGGGIRGTLTLEVLIVKLAL